ncbi:MAG: YhfC family intramembrane metalloprotease [Ruminococcus sp.]|nr:YhfC family intramembrane metalloprotease [Ruminococcus sp.]
MGTAEVTYSLSALWGYALETVFSLCFPIVLFLYFRKRFGGFSVKPLLVGFGTYLAVSLVRAVFRTLILTDGVKEIPALFYFLSALLSGVLEELGRYLALKYALDGFDGFKDAVAYGIGHGGTESILGMMPIALNGLLVGLRCNDVGIAAMTAGLEPDRAAAYAEKIQGFADNSVFDSLYTVASWINSAFACHIALSVLVLISVHYVGQQKQLFIAMAIHTFFDVLPPLIVWTGFPFPLLGELIFGGLTIYYTRRVWKSVNGREA